MPDPTKFTVEAPGLIQMILQVLQYLWKLITNDKELRVQRSQNAPQILKENNVTVDSTAVFTIPGADSMQQTFTTLLVVTDEASGKGRYNVSGRAPTAAGQGIPVPSGGTFIEVEGNVAIRQFAIIAESGQTLNVWYGVLQ